MAKHAVIHLLVVARAQDDAELVESHLRNSGNAVRARWVATPDEAYEALGERLPDLILCADDVGPGGASPVLDVCRKRAPRVPLVVVSNVRNMERLVSMMDNGARDVVARRNLRHMEMVIRRELLAYRQAQELADALRRLQDMETRHQALLRDTREAVAYVQEGIITGANPAFCTLLGYQEPDQLEGVPAMDLMATHDRAVVRKQLHAGRAGETRLPLTLCCADGRELPVEVHMRPVEVGGEQQIELVIHSGEQISGEAPRPAGLEAIFEHVGQLARDTVVLAFIHVDDLDGLEQRLGLRDTERLLNAVQDAIGENIAGGDRLFRLGAGEFALIVDRPDENADDVAEALRASLAGRIFTVQDHSQPVTLSQAVYPLAAGLAELDDLLREGRDKARALSRAGGDVVERMLHNVPGSSTGAGDGLWEKRIEAALEDDGFYLAFQSIASLEDDTQRHFDVFLRLRGGGGEEIMPGEFLPSAERLGLGARIDRWVIERVLELLAQRRDDALHSCVFVKLSADSSRDAALGQWIGEQLERFQVAPGQLVFQVREHLVQNHVNEVKVLADAVKAHGCRFAVDHFGDSGQALPILDHVPVDFIKIAPHLTQALGETRQAHVKLRQIMERAQELKIKTVAEYVQNANAMALLWQLGVNFIQGNFVQPPEVVTPYAEAETD